MRCDQSACAGVARTARSLRGCLLTASLVGVVIAVVTVPAPLRAADPGDARVDALIARQMSTYRVAEPQYWLRIPRWQRAEAEHTFQPKKSIESTRSLEQGVGHALPRVPSMRSMSAPKSV